MSTYWDEPVRYPPDQSLTWYFTSGTEPVREIVPDPFLTWELRAHFEQPAEPPSAEPETLEHKRIAHNAALAAGDTARAAALYAKIDAALTPVRARFDDGTELLGTTFHEGAESLLTIYLRSGGPTANGVDLTVRSRVIAGAVLSTTMADPVVREVGLPTAISPERWKAGYLYADPVPIRKRPGIEVFSASFTTRGRGAVWSAAASICRPYGCMRAGGFGRQGERVLAVHYVVGTMSSWLASGSRGMHVRAQETSASTASRSTRLGVSSPTIERC